MSNKTMQSICIYFVLHIVMAFSATSADLQFCSFFNNRAPKAQPGLKNCTWFKENSCCLQQEIEETFGRVKPLQGASLSCQKYMNYLMCYICAPFQNIFYQGERLTVCEDMCDALYGACKSAIFKGSVIRDLYSNGVQFCRSLRFSVAKTSCFQFDASWSMSDSHPANDPNSFLITVLVIVVHLVTYCISQQHFKYIYYTNKPKKGQIIDNTCANIVISIFRKLLPQFISYIILKMFFFIRMIYEMGKQISKLLLMTDNRLSFAMLLVLHNARGADTLRVSNDVNENTIRQWSEQISKNFLQLSEKGLHYPDVQDMYDRAEYTRQYINGTKKVRKIQEKLYTFFSSKKELALRLAAEVRFLHDNWLNKHTETLPNHLRDLDGSIYTNADIPEQFSVEDKFIYNSDFTGVISEKRSTVKIPDEVEMDNEKTIENVMWTSRLDRIFKENRMIDKDIKWQYFGSSSGIMRVYPGHQWQRNFIGFQENYDPRLRPWYLSAVSGPKDILLILDGSLSMKKDGNLERLKAVVAVVIGTLTRQDYVSVIVSRSSYWTRSGKRIPLSSHPLTCRHLAPASDGHKRELIAAINQIEAHGASDHWEAFKEGFSLLGNSSQLNCQVFVVFVTDGAVYDDPQIRCTPGYYKYDEHSRKNYVMGKLCQCNLNILKTDIENLLFDMRSKTIHTFSFLTTGRHHSVLPSTEPCSSRLQSTATITSGADIVHQMAPYFQLLLSATSSSPSQDGLWTSSYIDTALLGRVVTIAVPVTSNVTHQNIGVVGIDVLLEKVETLIRDQLWGDVYSFLISREEGTAVIHPLIKPSAMLLEQQFDVPISLLETKQGEPRDFARVLRALQRGETGDIRITRHAVRAVAIDDRLIWVPVPLSHYFYTNIPESPYSLALNVAGSDATYLYLSEPNGDENRVSHDNQRHLDADDELPDNISSSQHRSTADHPDYKGVLVNLYRSSVKLAPRSFCSPELYLSEHVPSAADIDRFITTQRPNTGCPQGTFHKDVRPDVHLTGRLDALWLGRGADVQGEIRWSYVGTRSGVMRTYPGTALPHHYNPSSEAWYRHTSVNRGLLSVSGLHRDAHGLPGRLVSLSQAVVSSTCDALHTCTGLRRHCGCECDEAADCLSDHCGRDGRCTHGVVQAVIGVDITYEHFEKLGTVPACSAAYWCAGEPCETRCHLVDENANILTDPSFSKARTEPLSLATKYGHVFSLLVAQQVFTQQRHLDYQAVCSLAGNKNRVQLLQVDVPSSRAPPRSPQSADPLAPHTAPYPGERSCIKEVVHYTLNQSAVAAGADLQDDPCADGSFMFRPVVGTNLHLLVLYRYRRRDAALNVNCHIRNRVLAPSALAVKRSWCVGGMLRARSAAPPRRCATPAAVVCDKSCSPSRRGAGGVLVALLTAMWVLTEGPHSGL